MADLFSRIFCRVGSQSYYASYERAFERLTKDINKLKVKKAKRKSTKDGFNNKVAIIGLVGTLLAFLHAYWRASHPEGTYGFWRTTIHVLAVVLMPLVTYGVLTSADRITGLGDRWDNGRLTKLQARLAKLIAELKDSTRYDRTQALLQKYDPTYRPPQQLLRTSQGAAASVQGTGGQAGVQPTSKWMSALDSVASRLVATDPIMLQGLRDAKAEVEMLRSHLAAAQWQCIQLAAENQGYRLQLGLPPAPQGDEPPPAAYIGPGQQQQQLLLPPVTEEGQGANTAGGSTRVKEQQQEMQPTSREGGEGGEPAAAAAAAARGRQQEEEQAAEDEEEEEGGDGQPQGGGGSSEGGGSGGSGGNGGDDGGGGGNSGGGGGAAPSPKLKKSKSGNSIRKRR